MDVVTYAFAFNSRTKEAEASRSLEFKPRSYFSINTYKLRFSLLKEIVPHFLSLGYE